MYEDFALQFSDIKETNEGMRFLKLAWGHIGHKTLGANPYPSWRVFHRVGAQGVGTLSTSEGGIGMVQFTEVAGCALELTLQGDELALDSLLLLCRVHEGAGQGLVNQAFQLCQCCCHQLLQLGHDGMLLAEQEL